MEDKPFHGVREVQSHLRARHFGTKQVNTKKPPTPTRPTRSHKRNQVRQRRFGPAERTNKKTKLTLGLLLSSRRGTTT